MLILHTNPLCAVISYQNIDSCVVPFPAAGYSAQRVAATQGGSPPADDITQTPPP